MSERGELVITTNDSMALQALPKDADAPITDFEIEQMRLGDEELARGFDRIMRAGERYALLKDASVHGRFMRLCSEVSVFSHRTINQVTRIARDPNMLRAYRNMLSTSGDSQHAANLVLPSDKTILEELCGLEPERFDGFVKDGVIHADMKRGDTRRALVKAVHLDPEGQAAPLPEGTYGAILADPPWQFKLWGDGGSQRAPDRHYPTIPLEEIKALPVGELAAKDCALFLWAVQSMLPQAVEVMEAWGFEFRTSAFVWVKEGGAGLGYWTRKDTEICLLGIKGSPKRLNADVREAIKAKRGRHSEKPAEVYRRIERLVPGPYMELFARKAHLGWNRWGNDPTLKEEGR